jgi:DNA-binding response OmpR family regulator
MARILVLEDDVDVRSVIRVALEADGHSVLEAADGAQIEVSVADYQPDLVITDILMEGRDGFEAIPALRRRFPDLPILAVSGGGGTLDTNDILGTATTLGADATLTKPFRIATLVGAIAYLLRKTGAAGAQPAASDS